MTMRAALLAEFDGSVCPACHHKEHEPPCPHCRSCELHTDEALAFVLRIEPELVDRIVADEVRAADHRNYVAYLRGRADGLSARASRGWGPRSLLPDDVSSIPIEGLEARWRACLLVPSLQAYQSLVADLFVTARDMEAKALDRAGHRTAGPHDCFALHCRDIGPQLETLLKELREHRCDAATDEGAGA